MSDQYIGEIRAVGFNFAPPGWHLCDGTILQVNQYQALYAVLANTYGGTAPVTFGLPDLRGRMIVCPGSGPGLNPVVYGQAAGANTAQLTAANLPVHTHLATVTDPGHTHAVSVPAHTHSFTLPDHTHPVSLGVNMGGSGSSGNNPDISGLDPSPTNTIALATNGVTAPLPSGVTGNPSGTPSGTSGSASTGMAVVIQPAGSPSSALPIQPPFLGCYYIIALEGIYPTRQ